MPFIGIAYPASHLQVVFVVRATTPSWHLMVNRQVFSRTAINTSISAFFQHRTAHLRIDVVSSRHPHFAAFLAMLGHAGCAAVRKELTLVPGGRRVVLVDEVFGQENGLCGGPFFVTDAQLKRYFFIL